MRSYLTLGKFSEAKFNRSCLAEYAETFPTVCVDAAFYTFPTVAGLTGLAELVPTHLLAEIPRGWQYAVEIRNKTFLHPYYLAMLQGHGVSHCFNSWERMLPVSEQVTHPGIMETADFLTGRFLITPGRKYQAAVDVFQPYTETKAPDPDARDAARRLIAQARGKMRQLSFFFFNNRLEGNALKTISAVTGVPSPGSSP